ncbi:hypothetical protein EGM70_12115 [Enterobacteriaceae bacterium 89]|nr:hypothetical protein [Enterobacteriaceae bacterium 89]
MKEQTIYHDYNPALYSELSVGNPDFIDLAERCELLSQIIVDANETETIAPVLRCLSSYLHKLSVSLEEDMSELRIIELTTEKVMASSRQWIFADSDLQCEYCQALTLLLMRNNYRDNEREVLTGLLHDLISFMTYELKEPRFGILTH